MEELDRYYTVPLREFLKKYKKNTGYYEIPLKIFVFNERATKTQAEYQMKNLLNRAIREKFVIFTWFNYNYSKIIIKELKFMKKSFYIEFPYMEREKYFPFLVKAQNIISCNGIIVLAVNNIHSCLKSVFIIECVDNEEDRVKELIREYNLISRADKGFEEIIKEQGFRMWNTICFPINCTNNELESMFNSMFLLASNEELEKRGFDLDKNLKRKQVFISYSHKDKK